MKRFKTRQELYREVLPACGVGAELGVDVGDNASDLLAITNPKKLYLCDSWIDQEGLYKGVKWRFAQDPRVECVRADDIEWLLSLPDQHLDWAYIDTMHTYEQTAAELKVLMRKVKFIIAGHDLCCSYPLHRNYADQWAGGVLFAVMEAMSEGWLQIEAVTVPDASADEANHFPSWACRVSS